MKTQDNGYIINISQPLSCRDTGKFEAPSSDWRHDALPLDDTYELCVVTKGILYLKYRGISLFHPRKSVSADRPPRSP